MSILSCKSFYRKHGGGDGSSSECARSSESVTGSWKWMAAVFDRFLCNRAALFRDHTAYPNKTCLRIASLTPSPQQETASVRTFLLLLWRILHFWNRKAHSFSYRFRGIAHSVTGYKNQKKYGLDRLYFFSKPTKKLNDPFKNTRTTAAGSNVVQAKWKGDHKTQGMIQWKQNLLSIAGTVPLHQ